MDVSSTSFGSYPLWADASMDQALCGVTNGCWNGSGEFAGLVSPMTEQLLLCCQSAHYLACINKMFKQPYSILLSDNQPKHTVNRGHLGQNCTNVYRRAVLKAKGGLIIYWCGLGFFLSATLCTQVMNNYNNIVWEKSLLYFYCLNLLHHPV